VGQREVPAGDYFSLGPQATALHQFLHWERPATGFQDSMELIQREAKISQTKTKTESREHGVIFTKSSQIIEINVFFPPCRLLV